jgi:hypothetical protein
MAYRLRVRAGYVSVGDDSFTSVSIYDGDEKVWHGDDLVRGIGEFIPETDLEILMESCVGRKAK